MEWKKVSPETVDLLDRIVAPYPAERRKMFGCPVYFVRGNMFAGVHSDDLFLRLSPSDREEIVRVSDEVRVFEPMEGRPMREYMVVPEPLLADPEFRGKWLDRSYAYVSSLPIKEPKPPKTK